MLEDDVKTYIDVKTQVEIRDNKKIEFAEPIINHYFNKYFLKGIFPIVQKVSQNMKPDLFSKVEYKKYIHN